MPKPGRKRDNRLATDLARAWIVDRIDMLWLHRVHNIESDRIWRLDDFPWTTYCHRDRCHDCNSSPDVGGSYGCTVAPMTEFNGWAFPITTVQFQNSPSPDFPLIAHPLPAGHPPAPRPVRPSTRQVARRFPEVPLSQPQRTDCLDTCTSSAEPFADLQAAVPARLFHRSACHTRERRPGHRRLLRRKRSSS